MARLSSVSTLALLALIVALSWITYSVVRATNARDREGVLSRYRHHYSSNDGSGDPETSLQNERFDYERMVSAIPRVGTPPERIDEYTVNGTTTGLFERWNVDHETLGDACDWLVTCARYRLNEDNDSTIRDRCLDVLDDFTKRYGAAMRGKFDRVFPWGRNWYQFSISSTQMLFHYMLVARPNDRDRAARLVLSIIESPVRSLGMTRKQANSVYMALPWIVAHHALGDHETSALEPSYRYVTEYIRLKMVRRRKDEGLYLDGTYITHTNVLAYGYLVNMTTMCLPLIAFDNVIRNFMLDWQRCRNILMHPTIPYTAPGIFSRAATLRSHANPGSPYGVRVIPECLFVRMFGPDYSFAMRGQNAWIAYYESDRTNDDMAQYWVLDRTVRFADRDYEPEFPSVGFVYPKYRSVESGGAPVATRCRVPTRTSTTTSFLNGEIVRKPLRYSFVFGLGNLGILRHFFRCTEMTYDPNDPAGHGRFDADELVVCDYERHTVETWLRVEKSYSYDMILMAERPHEWLAGSSSLGVLHMLWNCETRVLTSDFRTLDTIVGVIEAKYPPGITVVDTDDTVMLLRDGLPTMAMYPDGASTLDLTFVTTYKGERVEFAHNQINNQYCRVGLCVNATF